ncbi:MULTISPECIES: RNA-guided endonuclease InsQ/TnpB family protein [Streptomyces]|uniref:RNA-guided endonuclease TnpB family protein n=1 Tax=Streptomyces evansiae TaxID=3075535 RepID=A0ABU2QXH7_9ACTN|nr:MULTISPECIES: RNA-guided endonuclease TnpB family protein [unclassified Streptomyces]MDT0409075.1 RNA-guided endonuclease TnpB family protein [Streptomyces sp. DSM 41979]MYQ59276.1 transposase [Streptomyces sp. SID4926]SCE55361.1 putative transposase [Streptomyces sp. DfronAA-171]
MMQTEILRAFRFTLAPTPAQEQRLLRWCGNSRLAFNYALAAKKAAHEDWRAQVAELVDAGVDEASARKRVRAPTPTKPTVYKRFVAERGDDRHCFEGVAPWWHEVNTYVFQSAFLDADAAWKNWLDSFKGKRAGRRVGYPRFKKRGVARDSFRLHHDVKKPGIRLATYRRLRLPAFGEIRLHDSARRLDRLISRDEAVIQSVTVSRSGHRWYASVLCKVQADLPDKPTHAQRAAGSVGVDLGVKMLAALSRPLNPKRPDTEGHFVDNPRHLAQAAKRLGQAQRALSRKQKGSARRDKARRRVARLHHEIALRWQAALHQLTKKLATRYAAVHIEDLHVAGMTATARGTLWTAPAGKYGRRPASTGRSSTRPWRRPAANSPTRLPGTALSSRSSTAGGRPARPAPTADGETQASR